MEDQTEMTVSEALRMLLNFFLIVTIIFSVLAAIFFFGVTAMVAPPPDQRAGAQWAGDGPSYGMIAAAIAFTSELVRRLFVRKPRISR